MKFAFLPVILALSLSAAAQDTSLLGNSPGSPPQPNSAVTSENTTPYSVAARGPHHRIWQQIITKTDVSGKTVVRTNSYTELATGLHHWNGTEWVDSSDQIQVTQSGATSTNGQHHVNFSANINTAGAIELTTSDGQLLRSHIVGLAYFDTVTSNSVMFAELQDSLGQLLQSSNQVLYTNAFTDVQADVLYINRIGGFEQNVVLRRQPPFPAAYGLNPQTTRLQIWTEFTEAPQPTRNPTALGEVTGVPDEQLVFGTMRMGRGKAFSIGSESAMAPVGKHWTIVEGRTFLVEEVPLPAIAEKLLALPSGSSSSNANPVNPSAPPTGGSNGAAFQNQSKTTALLNLSHPVYKQFIMPAPKTPKKPIGVMQLAVAEPIKKGLVLDYDLQSLGNTNFTLQADTTYYVSNNQVNFDGVTTIEGGAVVKFSTNGAANLTFNGNLTNVNADGVICHTGPYLPAVFTASDDNSVGQAIPGSTGTPSGYYGEVMINIETGRYDFKNLRINYARVGIWLDGPGTTNTFTDIQIGKCQTGMFGYISTNKLYNALIYGAQRAFGGDGGIRIDAENLTVDSCGYLAHKDASEFGSNVLTITNGLVVAFTNWGDFDTVTTNYVATNSSSGSVFQIVGAANYYLPSNSIYRSAGTTNIDSALLTDLRKKTTQAPLVLSNVTNSTATTLSPQVPRDTGPNLDFGYHYDPLDYILRTYIVTNASLTLTNGVAIACDNDSAGIWLQDGSSLISTGTPNAPNWITHYQTVQEQPISIGALALGGGQYVNSYHYGSTGPNATLRFTKFSFLGNPNTYLFYDTDAWAFNNLSLRDSELWGGGSTFTGAAGATATIENCLFYRSVPEVFLASGATLNFSNNLVVGTTFFFLGSSGTCYAYNNAFDSCTIIFSAITAGDYNAYLNYSGRLSPNGSYDYLSGSVPTYETGPLGYFYHPSSSALKDIGSTNAGLLGFYHYTTQTNQLKEGTSKVDIGYHYVAVDNNGTPLDYNQNGEADYVENPYGPVAPGIVLLSSTNHYLIGASPTNIDLAGIILDQGCTNYNGGGLTITFAAGWHTNDSLGINNQGTGAGQIGLTNNNVTFGNTNIGTYTLGASTLTVLFGANSTPVSAQALLTNITFHYYPGATEFTSNRVVQFVVTNGCGQASDPAIKTIAMDCPSALDVVLLIDRSGSMTNTAGNSQRKIDAAKLAATYFLGSLQLTNDKVALVTFSDSATTNSILTNNFAYVSNKIAALSANGSTAISNGVATAQGQLPTNAGSTLKLIILLTDGVPNLPTNNPIGAALNAANTAKQAGIRLITIGLGTAGTDFDPNLLTLMASSPDDYHYASNTTVLQPIYTSIAQSLCRAQDPPTVLLTSPINGSFYSPDSNVFFSASVTVDSSRVISQVEFFDDVTNSLGIVTSSPYQLTLPFLPIGTNHITAVATDSGGLTATSSNATVTVRGRPVVNLLFPLNGTSLTTGINFTNKASVISSNGVSTVQFFLNTNFWANGTNLAGNYGLATNLPAGVYPVSAIATDTNGVKGYSAIEILTVTNTNTAPTIAITFPANNQTFVANSTITITALTTNGSSGIVTNVEFFANGISLGNDTNAPWTVTECCWKPGAYQLVARAIDTLGQTAVSTNVQITILEKTPGGSDGFWDPTFTIPDPTAYVLAVDSYGSNLFCAIVDPESYFTDMIYRWDGSSWTTWNPHTNQTLYNVYALAATEHGIYYADVRESFIRIFNYDGTNLSQLGTDADSLSITSVGNNWVKWLSLKHIGPDLFLVGALVGNDYSNNPHVFRYNSITNGWEAVGNKLYGNAYAIESFNGHLIVGGRFEGAGTYTNVHNIVQLNNGVWEPLGLGVQGTNHFGTSGVYSLAACGSNLFVGGDFTIAGGLTNANGLAVWNGQSWRTIGEGVNGVFKGEDLSKPVILSLAVRGNTVYAAGQFTGISGLEPGITPVSAVAKAEWDEDQQQWTWSDMDLGVFDGVSSGSFDGWVAGITLMDGPTDGMYDLVVGGSFGWAGTGMTNFPSAYYQNLARWSVGRPLSNNVPSVSIVSPTNYTLFTNNPSTLTITATNKGTLPFSAVEFYVDSTRIATDTTTGTNSYSQTWATPANGVHLLKAIATGTNGIRGESKPVLVSLKSPTNAITANDDSFTLVEGSLATVLPVLSNDSPSNGLRINQLLQLHGSLGTAAIAHDGSSINYTPFPKLFGTDRFAYTITNSSGASDSAWVTVKILSKPQVQITNLSPEQTFGTSTTIAVNGNCLDYDGFVTNVALYLNGQQFGQTTNPAFSFSWSTSTVGWYTFSAVATDNDGLTNQSSLITIAITNSSTATNVLTASIDNLAGTTNALGDDVLPVIQAGFFDLQGKARDSNGGDAVSYSLLLIRPQDEDAGISEDPITVLQNTTPFRNVTPGTLDVAGFRTNGDSSGDLGKLDFSTVPNGVYDLLLVVHGGGGETNAWVRFRLDSQLKIGQFSFSEQDTIIPADGIPITVVRTYNSLNNYSGDFGYDWTFSLISMDISLDEQRQTFQLGGPNVPYPLGKSTGAPQMVSIRTGGGRNVTLTLPDGRRTTFAYQPQGEFVTADAQWVAPANIHASLRTSGNSEIVTLPYLTPFWAEGTQGSDYESHDVPGWVLTTQDGTRYNIGRGPVTNVLYNPPSNSGTNIMVQIYGTPRLTSIFRTNGESLAIGPNSITHYTSTGAPTRSVYFDRDGVGRIIAVHDPISGSNGAPLLQYVYNQDNGNLLQVLKLQDRVAGTYTTNKYHYDNPNFPHYLTSIENALGVPVARNEYDDQGRLTAVTDALGNRTAFTHNTSNDVEVVTDALQNTNSFVYDLNGNVTIKTNALQQVTQMTYDANNNKLTDYNVALNATTSYGYDANNYLTTTTNALGFTNLSIYDKNGLLWTNIDARGAIITNNYDTAGNLLKTVNAYSTNNYTYDGNNRPLLSVDALGNTTSNSYDAIGNLTNVTVYDTNNAIMSSMGYAYDDNGNRTSQTAKRTALGIGVVYDTTTYVFDAQNRLVETIDPLGNSNSVIYNAIGKQQATIDQLGHPTQYFYDDKGNLTNTRYADGSTEASVYNALNQRIIAYNRLGYTNLYFYDALGRVTNSVAPDNTTNLTFYDVGGRIQYAVDAIGTTNAFGYDLLGQQIAVTNGWLSSASNVMTYTYDENGNQKTVTDALSHSSTNVYDLLGRVTTNWFADGTKQVTSYDPLGHKIEVLDQTNNPTWFGYDGLGRLTSVTDALSKVTRYAYDEVGNQTNQVDALLRTNTYFYDALGRRVKHTLPDTHSETFGYDPAGNQVLYTNFNSVIITNQYDSMNRLKNRASVGGTLAAFTYTTNGQRATMVDPSGTYTYIYDVMDRLFTYVTPQGTLNYQYSTNGNLTNVSSSTTGGTSVGYQYDSLSRLTNVVDYRLSGTQNTVLGYDPMGNLKKMQYPNGVANLYQYDNLNRLTTLTWTTNGNTIASFAYQLSTTGNRTGLNETVGSVSRNYSWGYDAVYKLTGETIVSNVTTSSLGYTYDDVGNRLTRTVTGFPGLGFMTNQSFTYDTNDWLTSDAYDFNGNTTNSTGTNYLYDAENRLTNVMWTGHSVSIVYNGDGERVSKTVDGTTTLYLVDSHNLTGYAQVLEEFASDTNHLTRAYTYGLSLISQRLSGTSTNFFGFDGHGSVRFLTSNSGTITDTYTYDAYGELINSTGATDNKYLYCGDQWDVDLGLYYLRSRYSNPHTGRFCTMDAFEGVQTQPMSLHKYLYVFDNPVRNTDHSGRDPGAITSIVDVNPMFQVLVAGMANDSGWVWKGVIVNAVILNDTTRSSYESDFKLAQKTFGLANIALLDGSITPLNADESSKFLGDRFLVEEGGSDANKPSVPEARLMKKYVKPGQITIFYVKGFKATSEGDLDEKESGEAYQPIYFAPVLAGAAFVSGGETHKNRSVAHEIGHVLGQGSSAGMDLSLGNGVTMENLMYERGRGTDILRNEGYAYRMSPLLKVLPTLY